MTIENIMQATRPATYTHLTMSRSAYRFYLATVFGYGEVKGHIFRAPYQQVEYLNAPAGLIVLAHHAYVRGQVDGIHPASLSHHIDDAPAIVEPFGRSGVYAEHYLPRKWQGALVIGAFGRMIDAGDPEAPRFTRDVGYFTLETFDGPDGPIVAVIEKRDTIHVIHAAPSAAEREPA